MLWPTNCLTTYNYFRTLQNNYFFLRIRLRKKCDSQCVTIYKTVRTKDYYTSLVNVTSENYNARLIFSSCYCSNDINWWFKFKIQATSKTERMTSSFSGLFLWNLEGKSTGNKIVENGYLQEYKVRQFFCAIRKFSNAYSSFHRFVTEHLRNVPLNLLSNYFLL